MATALMQRRPPRWRQLAAAALALVFLAPVVVMISGSLRRPGAPPPRTPQLIPEQLSLSAYAQAFDLVDLATQLRNSVVVATLACAIGIVTSSLAGFVIVRARRRLSSLLIALAVVGVVVPPTALVIGRFSIYRSLGVLDTFVPLIAPALFGVSSFGALMFAWAFRQIPVARFEVATVEGVSALRAWWTIALPLARPMTVAVGALAFVATWNDFVSPLVYLTSADLYTLPMGLRALQLVGPQDTPVLLAACVVASLPIGVFGLTQRRLLTARVDR